MTKRKHQQYQHIYSEEPQPERQTLDTVRLVRASGAKRARVSMQVFCMDKPPDVPEQPPSKPSTESLASKSPTQTSDVDAQPDTDNDSNALSKKVGIRMIRLIQY
jgi:hypothetical protein